MIQQINVRPNYPNQSLKFTANNQNISLNLYFRGYVNLPDLEQEFINKYAPPNFFADIFLSTQAIIQGEIIVDRTPINLYPSDLIGYLISVDTRGNSNPTLINLGVTVFFYYIDNLDELTNLTVGSFAPTLGI